MPDSEIVAWERVGSTKIADCRVFQVRRDIAIDPRDSSTHDFYVIEACDWINVIPVTSDDQVVLIEQYRHGSNEVTLEIPGGMVDEGESAVRAAGRELLEETGYSTSELKLLGRTRPNPAIQNNWLHSFVAWHCEPSATAKPDISEHIAVRLVPLREIKGLIRSGAIDHSLVVASFYLFEQNPLSTSS